MCTSKSLFNLYILCLQSSFQDDNFLFYVFYFAAGGMLFYHLVSHLSLACLDTITSSFQPHVRQCGNDFLAFLFFVCCLLCCLSLCLSVCLSVCLSLSLSHTHTHHTHTHTLSLSLSLLCLATGEQVLRDESQVLCGRDCVSTQLSTWI